eukprot:scaffold117864_cov20-Cyclotella_meneghiniana.AAC.1
MKLYLDVLHRFIIGNKWHYPFVEVHLFRLIVHPEQFAHAFNNQFTLLAVQFRFVDPSMYGNEPMGGVDTACYCWEELNTFVRGYAAVE